MPRIYGTSQRFIEEVEQVCQAPGLSSENFYLYGHSSGGTLATEYVLKYQQLFLKYDAYAEEATNQTV